MQYIQLRQALKEFTLFSIADIKRVDSSFHRRRLNDWQDKGYIKKLIKRYYIFSDLDIDENALFEIGNKLYDPSYISLETALSYYGLIPESVYGITSVSTRKTYKFKSPIAEFSYRTVAPRLFFGYELVKYGHKCFKIATPEKALLDYFYIRPELKNKPDFLSLRINTEILFKKINRKKFNIMLNKVRKKQLKKRMKVFWKAMENA